MPSASRSVGSDSAGAPLKEIRSRFTLMGRAGFAKVPITPPLGVELAGYGVYLGRRATEVHDDLFARALALEDDEGERVLLLSLDLLGLSWELNEAIAARSSFLRTVVTTIFGPYIGYLPDRDDFAARCYAATLVPRILRLPPFSPAVGDALVDGALALIESLEG
jgi:hypothetical protein